MALRLIAIIKNPDEYLSKGIRLKGNYSAIYNGYTNDYNYTLTIRDNAQCCTQSIVFILKKDGNLTQKEEVITLPKVLVLFEEGKYLYCYIKNAKIE